MRQIPERLDSLADRMAVAAATTSGLGTDLVATGEATAWHSLAADSFRADLAATAAETERTAELVRELEAALRDQATEVRQTFAAIDAARAWVGEQVDSARQFLGRVWDGVVDFVTGTDVDRAEQIVDLGSSVVDELDTAWLDVARRLGR